MKRFVNISNQINLDTKEFAFYCTVYGRFEIFNGSQTWKNKEEFVEDYDGNELERYLGLIPKDWNKLDE